MSAVLGATFSSRKNVHKWAKLFKEGRNSVEDEDNPRATVSNWLRLLSKHFYAEGIRKTIHRWHKCVIVQRDYVEK